MRRLTALAMLALSLPVLRQAQAAPGALLQVQPIAGWTLREAVERNCGPGVPDGNPVFIALQDVDTPAGPGVRVDALGVTLLCCETISATKRFPVGAHLSANAALSFHYSAQLALGNVFGDVIVTFTFYRDGQAVATRRLAAVPPGPVHTPIDAMIPNHQVVPLALETFLGQVVFDEIQVSLDQYGCIFNSTQRISDLTLSAQPALSDVQRMAIAVTDSFDLIVTEFQSGQMNRGTAQSLTTQLEHALLDIAGGDFSAAERRLHAFLHALDGLSNFQIPGDVASRLRTRIDGEKERQLRADLQDFLLDYLDKLGIPERKAGEDGTKAEEDRLREAARLIEELSKAIQALAC